MDGQYELFGLINKKKRRPCEYSFQRYIGQRVIDGRGEHIIKQIEPYYTIYADGMVGSPYDMSPVNEKEYLESIRVEIEYEKHKLNSQHKGTRSMAQKNIEILEKELKSRGKEKND